MFHGGGGLSDMFGGAKRHPMLCTATDNLSFDSRAFGFTAAQIWNSLPLDI